MKKKSAKGSEASNRGESRAVKMARLRSAMQASDKDESSIGKEDSSVGFPDSSRRVRRDANGRRASKLKSVIRDAILEELGNREITRYQLWKLARAHCATIPESAVYEFLRGQRHLGLEYIEALLVALGLVIAHPSNAA